ncbi:MAG: sensor domain-containing diguanylate cyclase [Thiomonas sp.]|uniref:Putative diguanylate cyclase n=1 Tax=mine drainage metagenome TaxID=410659 RepID=E6PW21_9ZZZZ
MQAPARAALQRLSKLLLFNAALAGVYVLLAWFVMRSGAAGALLWPSSAVAVFGVMVGGWAAAPGIALGAYLANAFSVGWSPLAALCIATGNTVGVLIAWWLLQRLRRPWTGLQGTGNTLAFIVTLGLLAPAFSAGGGMLATLLPPLPPMHNLGGLWLSWLVGDICSVLIFAPPLVLWWERRNDALPAPTPELLGVPVLALLGTVLIYFAPPTTQALPLGLGTLVLLPVLWAAIRLPMRLSSLFMAALFALELAGTTMGLGPMTALPPMDRITALQVMGISLACTVLLASSLAQDRGAALRQLREANAGLERAVERRTAALVESQTRLQRQLRFQDSLLSALPNPTAYTANDGRLALINKAFTQLLGRTQDAMLGRPPEDVFEDSLLHTWTGMDRKLLAEGRPLSQECRQLSVDGEESVWILNKAQVADSSGKPLGIVTSLQDISELKRLQDQLQRDEQRFRFLVDASPVPLVIIRLRDSGLMFSNRASDELFRASYAEHHGKPMRNLWADSGQREAIIARVLREGTVSGQEVKFRRFDGSLLWLLLSITHTHYQDEEALIFAFKDITPTKQRELRLQELAYTDSLTGVSNRRHFLAQASAAFHESRRLSHDLALLAIDVDHFKQLNDVYGHPAGDRALRSFSTVCKSQLRSVDLFGRLGGDEFAIVLPHCDGLRAYDFAQRLRLAIQESAGMDHAPLRQQLTVSIGIADAADPEAADRGIEDLLARADKALYQAKQRGRNRVEIWSFHDLALP